MLLQVNQSGTPTLNKPLQRNDSQALSSASKKQSKQLPDIKVKNSRLMAQAGGLPPKATPPTSK